MLKAVNKRFFYVLLAAFILMILGLIFIGAGHLRFSNNEFPPMNGFDANQIFGVSRVLSSEILRNLLDSKSGLDLIRCGIVFAVIFTPILFAVGFAGFGYNFMTLIKSKKTIKNEQEQVEII